MKSVQKDEPPYLEEYDIIEDYSIYRSNFNDSYFTIHDEEFEVYRVVEYSGMDPRELASNLKIYITYYQSLSDTEKKTLRNL
ncbi:MAG TPA: hypothetical protein VFM70_04630 [Salinimicrobium sp.]|nr:hypothetical protein [Salinimicrobium sp.]